jgi:hypothetical protein
MSEALQTFRQLEIRSGIDSIASKIHFLHDSVACFGFIASENFE